ncbi:hypothetical protein IQ254_07405 [Nodosilinea sp. LEGE 07088]|uniref:CU044_2847 family protein n=1 Tax=Nodosilinea sp. LEGE 07088 TaxID=2777968 RepID=UPI00187E85AA|nr:CU044_2847 family protein [Nodosilinea sp. LEGE 07088]MBE9137029.1 hypothetical protein [Nodosilinea sp. LEGE 07088]
MSKLTPIQLDDGSLIYIEASTDAEIEAAAPKEPEEPTRGIPGMPPPAPPAAKLPQSVQSIQNTIRAHTLYTLNAFKNLGLAEVSEITLSFGLSIDVQTGMPYIANGRASCSTEITVRCEFPKKE